MTQSVALWVLLIPALFDTAVLSPKLKPTLFFQGQLEYKSHSYFWRQVVHPTGYSWKHKESWYSMCSTIYQNTLKLTDRAGLIWERWDIKKQNIPHMHSRILPIFFVYFVWSLTCFCISALFQAWFHRRNGLMVCTNGFQCGCVWEGVAQFYLFCVGMVF